MNATLKNLNGFRRTFSGVEYLSDDSYTLVI